MSGHPGSGGGMMGGQPANESLQISVPNSAVGAIIGAGGANIKQIMRESGAFVNVSSLILYPLTCSRTTVCLATACAGAGYKPPFISLISSDLFI